jgi:hypothetical protein
MRGVFIASKLKVGVAKVFATCSKKDGAAKNASAARLTDFILQTGG